MTIKDKLKILVDGKEYIMDGFEDIGNNKFQTWLYHEENGIEIYEKREIELLSKIENDPIMLLINHKPYVMHQKRIGRDYRVESSKGEHVVRILRGYIPTIMRTKTDQIQPERPKKQIKEKRIVEGAIYSPMTGIISSVNIKVGEMVKKGDVILTLYIMKMENEICATKSGRVKEILVQKGKGVYEEDLLVVID